MAGTQDLPDADAVSRVVNGAATKSDKIRELHRLGMPTAHIARALGIRYQFARNVLVRDAQRTAPRTVFSVSEGERIDRLTRGLGTKAARIRALAAAGFDRSQIANALGLSYQHVYNVMSGGVRLADRVADADAGLETSPLATHTVASTARNLQVVVSEGPDPVRALVEGGGRIAIPVAFLEALRISEGDSVVLDLEGDELRLYGQDAALRRVRRFVAQHVPADVSLVDELIAERRHQAERETDDR
ncbi:MAG: AbrB/MazE/SpoVT family DNA-binding domain-containing protein [Acidobacteria bacterium]|nr:AbrB/MazE/SpoVT family DNA-binding domain-containing protein [Acidobacteriota bacterium]